MFSNRRRIFGIGALAATAAAVAAQGVNDEASKTKKETEPRQTKRAPEKPPEALSATRDESTVVTKAREDSQGGVTFSTVARVAPKAGDALDRRMEVQRRVIDELRNELQKTFGDAFPFSETGSVPNQERVHRIFLGPDARFRFAEETSDVVFRPEHADVLINQAAELLERCLIDRIEWDDKAVRGAVLALELTEYFRLDEIHREEERLGYYEVTSKSSRAEVEAMSEQSKRLGKAENHLDRLTDRVVGDAIHQQSGWAQLIGWLSHLSGYEEYRGLGSATWNGNTKQVVKHLHEASTEQSYFQLRNQADSFLAQWYSTLGDYEASKKRLEGMRNRAQWDARDIDFRKRRTAAARDVMIMKLLAAREPGGVFNYPEKLAAIEKRIQRDLRDALARLAAAEKGLAKIWGYTRPLPDQVKWSLEANDTRPRAGLVNAALEWTRDAISWLIRFTEHDQGYTQTISIKSNVGDSRWRTALESGIFEVSVREELFPKQAFIRLRGASLSTVGTAGIWSARIDAPIHSGYRRTNGNWIAVVQDKVGSCRLPTIFGIQSFHKTEIVGIDTWRNISPIGQWKVSMAEASISGQSLGTLDDIYLELTLASQAI